MNADYETLRTFVRFDPTIVTEGPKASHRGATNAEERGSVWKARRASAARKREHEENGRGRGRLYVT